MDLVVNVAKNWGIGRNGQLLVSISADLRRFRQLTTSKAVILGRKTLSTFPGGKPLKNRDNLILSAHAGAIPNAQVFSDLDVLKQELRNMDLEQVSVIGGASVYTALLPYCSKAYITKTLISMEADAFFPNLDLLENWHIENESAIMEENGLYFQYIDYVNTSPEPL